MYIQYVRRPPIRRSERYKYRCDVLNDLVSRVSPVQTTSCLSQHAYPRGSVLPLLFPALGGIDVVADYAFGVPGDIFAEHDGWRCAQLASSEQ